MLSFIVITLKTFGLIDKAFGYNNNNSITKNFSSDSGMVTIENTFV